MKIRLPFIMTLSETDSINLSITKKAKTQRINKIIKERSKYNSLLTLLDDTLSDLNRCFWCNSVTKIKDYNVDNIDGTTFLIGVTQIDNIRNCRRNDTNTTKNCDAKKLNSNSVEYVKGSIGSKQTKVLINT